MKLNTLIVAAVFASTTFSSCVFKTAGENQLKNTHTSLVDGDAYAFFRNVGTIAPYEVSYAEHVSKVGSPQAKEAASQVSKFFSEIDRKSTRLNSSHVKISYAVFCLKKKKENIVSH